MYFQRIKVKSLKSVEWKFLEQNRSDNNRDIMICNRLIFGSCTKYCRYVIPSRIACCTKHFERWHTVRIWHSGIYSLETSRNYMDSNEWGQCGECEVYKQCHVGVWLRINCKSWWERASHVDGGWKLKIYCENKHVVAFFEIESCINSCYLAQTWVPSVFHGLFHYHQQFVLC